MLRGEGEGGKRVKARPACTDPEDRERPWTAARTMEVLGQCPPRHCVATSVFRSCSVAESQGQCPVALLLSNLCFGSCLIGVV